MDKKTAPMERSFLVLAGQFQFVSEMAQVSNNAVILSDRRESKDLRTINTAKQPVSA